MVALPENPHQTRLQIDLHHEKTQDRGWREHLGASIIGDSCLRKLWYEFHWATVKTFPGRILRLFRRGQREEDVFIEDLSAIGINVWPLNPATGEQWRVSFLGGHFGGSLDGVGQGFVEAPKAPHVLEFKTHADKYFKKLVKDGLQEANPKHYAQCQVYMHGSKQLNGPQIKRAFYMAVNKNDDTLFTERVRYDREAAEGLIAKASDVIRATEPPIGISSRPDWYECKFCDHHDICHGHRVPAESCRTCRHVRIGLEDGTWRCSIMADKVLSKQDQMTACNAHLYPENLITFAQPVNVNYDNVARWVQYRLADGTEFYNIIRTLKKADELPPGALGYTSAELQHIDHQIISDPMAEKLRQQFGGTITGGPEQEPLKTPF